MRGGPSNCVPQASINKIIHWRLYKIERNSTRKAFASQDTPNGSLLKVRRTLITQLDLRPSFKSNPSAVSEALLLNPSNDLSHPELAPLMQALMTEGAPNALAMLQTKPADPLSPSTSVSAMSDPIRVVNAPTGTRLFPKVMNWMLRSSGVAEVEFDMVGRKFKGYV